MIKLVNKILIPVILDAANIPVIAVDRGADEGTLVSLIASNNVEGGKMAGEGSVKFMFRHVGCVDVAVGGKDPSEVEMMAIEAGAEDTVCEKDIVSVYTKIEDLQKVKENLEKAGLQIEGAGLVYAPTQKIELGVEVKGAYENLWEKLDEHDDVQEIFDNL